MDIASIPYKTLQCSRCFEETSYYCEWCLDDLCSNCKESHSQDLKTIDHNVVPYRNKFNSIQQQTNAKHSNFVCRKYCESCEVPVFRHCRWHKKQKMLDVRKAYITKREQYIKTINTVRSEALLYIPVLLPKIKADIKNYHSSVSLFQSEMLTKARKLIDLVDLVQRDFMNNVFCNFDFKHRCLKQKIEMKGHIVTLQGYIHLFEQSTNSPLQFLSSRNTCFPQLKLSRHTNQLSMTNSLNIEDIVKSLSGIKITEKGHRSVEIGSVLKPMSLPEVQHSLTLAGIHGCRHISCVTSDRIWVNDCENLILTNKKGDTIHCVYGLSSVFFSRGFPVHIVYGSSSVFRCRGFHTVGSENELIYIDRNNNIKKLPKDMKRSTTFIERTDSTWIPLSVYWSSSNRELLVGMFCQKFWTAKVTLYNQRGHLTQTIQHDNTEQILYRKPNFITENINGDVVVSDWDNIDYDSGAVVVTERGGSHRFSYTGRVRQSGSALQPLGICTDPLSHILVCDQISKAVHMLNRDGQFLSYILTKSEEIGEPWCLSYDFNHHRLWIGSVHDSKICLYRHITRQDPITNQSDVIESFTEIKNLYTEKLQDKNGCLLKLMSAPELIQSLRLTNIGGCYHISLMATDRLWVSELNNLLLKNTTGDTLYRVNGLCSGLYGVHAVNSENELIYIDENKNINKLSNDMKTSTIFLKGTYSAWVSQCVCWSAFTGDLLIGMCYLYAGTGKVTRYNQRGQLINTIQNDNTGRELFRQPNYITENNNGDVVVSDCDNETYHLYEYMSRGAVVVSNRYGMHRFSYTGHPSGSVIEPRGICTDALSHILLCDGKTQTVHLLDVDGRFLTRLQIHSHEMDEPWSLGYDINTHRLWVGSYDNKVCVYKYMYTNIQEAPAGKSE